MKRTMVTVVIPNYNGLRFMEDCFAAILEALGGTK